MKKVAYMFFLTALTCFVLFLMQVVYTAHTPTTYYEKEANHAQWKEVFHYGSWKTEFGGLEGQVVRAFESEPDKTYRFTYSLNYSGKGFLIEFLDEENQVLAKVPLQLNTMPGTPGKFNFNGDIDVESFTGKIKIRVTGAGAAGNLRVTWKEINP